MRRTGRRAGGRVVALAAAAAVGLTGCQLESSVVPAHRPAPVVVVATASFGEAEVVGHIYANALLRDGSRVRSLPQSGTPEEVLDAVVTGETTFTVGFTGALLERYDPSSEETSADDVYAAMMAALPEGVTAADPTPAEDRPVYVVTRHTAETGGLRTMTDLEGRCGEFALGARREALDDRRLAEAVGGAYDCSFGRRDETGPDPRALLDALRAGEVGVGLVHSADPILDEDDMVVLDDDRDALRAQQIVPVFRKGSLTEDQLTLVNRISGELTTEDVRDLLVGVEVGSATPADLANHWLDRHGY